MNLAVIFDPHFWPHRRHGGPLVKGINRRGSLCLDVGRRVVDTVNSKSASLIVAGDLVDSAGPVSPQFAHALRETLGRLHKGAYLMLGNHDMTSDGDHSLDVYTKRGEVQVCEDIGFLQGRCLSPDTKIFVGETTCLVPFHRDIRDARVRDVPLVIAHFGVYDDSFPAWAKKAKGAWHVNVLFDFMKERNIDIIQVGDWHGRQTWLDDGTRMGKILEQGRQEWSVNLANPLLDLAWLEERRVWLFRHRQDTRNQIVGESTGICPSLGEHKRCTPPDHAIGPSMPQSSMSTSGSSRTGDAEGEFASQRERFGEKGETNSLQSRAPILDRKHSLRENEMRPRQTLSNMPPDTCACAYSKGPRAQKSKIIFQGGALCSTGFDNPGLHGYGTLAFWDTDEHRLSWQEMPGPRFCAARSEEEEQAIVEEARRLGHNLFLRRYYEGERPTTPPGLEAYEALPAIVERAAAAHIPGDLWPSATPQQQAQLLVSHWLETLPMEDQDFITAYMARLL